MAPWWGGFWERIMRSVKDLLRKTIWRKSLDFEEMQTVLAEVEAAINMRPLVCRQAYTPFTSYFN